jgi:hypothetical protein
LGLFVAAIGTASSFHGAVAKVPKARGGRGEQNRGEAIFLGAVPVKARIRGHSTPLPAEVVVCANCHGANSRGPVLPGSTAGAAPRVDRALLLESRTRRGGPSSTYDTASFCNLLRTGIDPVFILVAREMPTYDIDEADCDALWSYLTETQPAPSGPAVKPMSGRPPKSTQETRLRKPVPVKDAGQ